MDKNVLTDEEYKDLQNAGIKLSKEELEQRINDNLKGKPLTKTIDTFPNPIYKDWDKTIEKAIELAEFFNSVSMIKELKKCENREKEEWELELEEIIKEEMDKISKEMEEYRESHPIFYDTITINGIEYPNNKGVY